MIVLGMSGKLGVGKNYVSDKHIIPEIIKSFKEERGMNVIPYYFSFGSFIKSNIYSNDTKNELCFQNLFVRKTSKVRERLQTYGTEVCRTGIRDDLWIRYVDIWMNIQSYQLDQLPVEVRKDMLPLFVIQDVRFKNELKYVSNRQNSVVVRVVAPGRNRERVVQEKSNSTHASEIDLDDTEFEFTIQNDEIDTKDISLEEQIRPVVRRFMEMEMEMKDQRST